MAKFKASLIQGYLESLGESETIQIYMVNGVRLTGAVPSFDDDALLLVRSPDRPKPQLVRFQNISTISPYVDHAAKGGMTKHIVKHTYKRTVSPAAIGFGAMVIALCVQGWQLVGTRAENAMLSQRIAELEATQIKPHPHDVPPLAFWPPEE
jgi:sRNA-binding regulator protein Hfq